MSAKMECLELRQLFAALPVTVDAGKTQQTIEAIGGAAMAWQQPAEYRNASYYDQLAGDLGASIVRAGVWPTFEITNDNNDPNVIDWTKFNDAAIASTMSFFQQMKARGVDRFLLTVWSPPGWMKVNNSASNGGFIRPDLRSEFAEYVSAVIQRAKSKWGIEITDVSLANEPWFVEPYQTASHSPVQLREEIKAISARLKQDGLVTKIVVPEDVSSLNRAMNYINTISADPIAVAAVSTWGSHYLNPQDMASLKAKTGSTGKGIWYTEVGNGNLDITAGLGLARGVDNMFTYGGATAYINWLFSNAPGTSEFESLMGGSNPNKKYYALKQFAHFVRPGAQLLTSTYAGDTVRVTSFKHPTSGAVSIVLSNNGASDAEVQINLKGTTVPTSFQQFRTSASEDCVELLPIVGASSMTLSIPAGSIVTLYNGPEMPAMPAIAPPGNLPVPNPYEGWNTDTLRNAAMMGYIDTLKTQLANGATIDAALGDGYTALLYASASPYYNALDSIKALVNAGANKNQVSAQGFTALHVAAMNPMVAWPVQESQPTDRVKLLLSYGLDPNATDGYGRTPLHYAAMLPKILGDLQVTTYDTSLLKALLDAGANPNVVDNAGNRPLDYANQEGFGPGAAMLKQAMGQNLATLGGKFFQDESGNGLLEDGEPGLNGRVAFLDLNKNGVLDNAEPQAVANLWGDYQFLDIAAGTYTLRQVLPANWSATTLAQSITLIAGDNKTNINLGSVFKDSPPPPPPPPPPATGSLAVQAYVDANKNSTRDAGEAALANVKVYIDANNNATLDAGETSLLTDAAGLANFANLAPANYRVRAVLPSGYDAYQQPASTITVVSAYASSVYFGYAAKPVATGNGQISGYIVNDKNKNGVWNSGEIGIGGRTVWLDIDNDGVFDANEPKQVTASNGKYTFAGLKAGTYKVRQVVPSGWKQIKPTNKAAFSVTLIAGQIKAGNDFMVSTV